MNPGTPPDPHPRKPRLVLPAGACDAHCHVFGPPERFPYAPERSYTPATAPWEQLLELHRFLGFERAVIVHPGQHGSDLRATLDALARAPERLRGTAILDPELDDPALEKLHAAGMRGVRFGFTGEAGARADLRAFRRTAERVAPLGWHLLVHVDPRAFVALREGFQDLPAPLVIDHMARVRAADGLEQPAFALLLAFLRGENCWVKVSAADRVSSLGPPFRDAVPFARALIAAAPGRVLWGSDWPHPNVAHMPNDGDLVDLIAELAPDPAQRQRLLVDNPALLYGFPPLPSAAG